MISQCYTCECNDKCHGLGLCEYHYSTVYRLDHPNKIRKNLSNYAKKHRKQLRLTRKKYRATEKGREATKMAVRRYEITHPERKKAWGKVHNIKNKPCKICGKLPTHKHHPDISKPLEIVFLCPLHHKQFHVI